MADATVPQAQTDGRPGTPEAAPGGHRPTGFRLYWWVCALVIGADQGSKALVAATLPVFESVNIVPGFLDIVHVQNAGVAFGLLNNLDGAYRGVLTMSLAVLALLGIAYYARQLRPEETLARIGLSLILGGAIGNVIDRVSAGSVLDFVDVYWRDWHFWAFNVADASITVGAILVFADLLLVRRHAPDSV